MLKPTEKRFLNSLTPAAQLRLCWRLYDKMAAGDHFGADYRTQRITHPHLVAVYLYLMTVKEVRV